MLLEALLASESCGNFSPLAISSATGISGRSWTRWSCLLPVDKARKASLKRDGTTKAFSCLVVSPPQPARGEVDTKQRGTYRSARKRIEGEFPLAEKNNETESENASGAGEIFHQAVAAERLGRIEKSNVVQTANGGIQLQRFLWIAV